MSELEIPGAAHAALDRIITNSRDWSWGHRGGMDAAVRAVAAPVVAAELRRLAKLADDRYQSVRVGRAVESSSAYRREGVELVLRDLDVRAAELDATNDAREGQS